MILIGTGSEVQYAVTAQQQLADRGHRCARGVDAVSGMVRRAGPGRTGTRSSRPTSRPGSAIEAGVGIGWRDLVGDAGRIISINHYGASAAGSQLFEEFGFTADTVVAAAQ